MKYFLPFSFLFLFNLILSPASAQEKVVVVKTAKEFIEAIGNNTTIVVDLLVENEYEMSENLINLAMADSTAKNEFLHFEELYEGERELVIHGVKNLKITGKDKKRTMVVTPFKYANVLNFKNCENLSFQKINFGHSYYSEQAACIGGVLRFENTKNVQINQVNLYGSGIYGIITEKVEQLFVGYTNIETCTYGAVKLEKTENAEFNICTFINNYAYLDLVEMNDCKNVRMVQCYFKSNQSYYTSDPGNDFNHVFKLKNTLLTVKDCTFLGNYYGWFANDQAALKLEASKPAFEEFYKSKNMGANTFSKGLYSGK